MCVENLKNNKTPGVDKIPNDVLKHTEIHETLLKLFSFCFIIGILLNIYSPRPLLNQFVKILTKTCMFIYIIEELAYYLV